MTTLIERDGFLQIDPNNFIMTHGQGDWFNPNYTFPTTPQSNTSITGNIEEISGFGGNVTGVFVSPDEKYIYIKRFANHDFQIYDLETRAFVRNSEVPLNYTRVGPTTGYSTYTDSYSKIYLTQDKQYLLSAYDDMTFVVNDLVGQYVSHYTIPSPDFRGRVSCFTEDPATGNFYIGNSSGNCGSGNGEFYVFDSNFNYISTHHTGFAIFNISLIGDRLYMVGNCDTGENIYSTQLDGTDLQTYSTGIGGNDIKASNDNTKLYVTADLCIFDVASKTVDQIIAQTDGIIHVHPWGFKLYLVTGATIKIVT